MSDFRDFRPFRHLIRVMSRQIDEKTKREFNIVMSGQFCTLAFFTTRSGPITAMIGTDRQGYVPGELIGFSAEVGSVQGFV